MDLSLEQLSNLPPSTLFAALPEFLATHISEPQARLAATHAVRERVATWTDAEGIVVRDHLASVGAEIQLYEALPLLRPLSRDWLGTLFKTVTVNGIENVDSALTQGPVVVIGNHLSYVDTQATDAALAQMGREDIANRLVTVAGPKVYEALFRRFAAACLSTLPVPQSGAVSNVNVSARDLARQAIQSLKIGKSLPERGLVLQIYPEGTRTRNGRMGSFLRGVHRYLAVPGCQIVPMSHSGTDVMFPIGSDTLSPADYTITYGTPISVEAAGSTRDALTAAWHAVRQALPEHLQPDADTPPLA